MSVGVTIVRKIEALHFGAGEDGVSEIEHAAPFQSMARSCSLTNMSTTTWFDELGKCSTAKIRYDPEEKPDGSGSVGKKMCPR